MLKKVVNLIYQQLLAEKSYAEFYRVIKSVEDS